jgi:hypothetical protein
MGDQLSSGSHHYQQPVFVFAAVLHSLARAMTSLLVAEQRLKMVLSQFVPALLGVLNTMQCRRKY